MKSMKSMMMGGVILLGLTMCLTSCEGTLDDIFGEWSRPTGNNGNTKTTIAVKSVTLDQTTLTKAVGDDAVTLTATVDPSDASDKTVTWKSSDASIAAVDANGKVTFEAAGTATITATATNGTEDAADDKTATCEVTISAKKVNVESVKLDKTTLKQTAGDAAVTLTATVTPDDATDKTVKWTSSNESVATVADGVVTFVAAGTATITATAPNGTDDTADDKTAECAVTVNAAAAKVTTAPTATTGTIVAGSTTALVTAGAADGGTMMYQATTTNTKPTSTTGFNEKVPTAEGRAAATYYVWYYAKADATHVDSEISATGIAVTITAKPSATVTTVPMATTGTIAEGSTTALVTAGVADGGTMMYKVTTTNTKPTSTTGFIETVPTAEGRAAGTYYVWYYAKADATHVDSEISVTGIAVTVIAYTMAANATSTDKGKLICTDGHIHANGADAECTKDRVALICYVGNDAETNPTYKHGLALALKDASTGAKWCDDGSETCLVAQYNDEAGAKGDMAGINNTDVLVGHISHTHPAAIAAREFKYKDGVDAGAHPTGTSDWFLPSAGQWQKMIDAAGSIAAFRDGFSGITGASNLAGYNHYKLSTEVDASQSWHFYFGSGSNWLNSSKGNTARVRACLAF